MVKILGGGVWTTTCGEIGETTIDCCGLNTVRWDTIDGLGTTGVPFVRNLLSPFELDRRSKHIF